jgi:peptidyl-prolyl cis-trans isomerase D
MPMMAKMRSLAPWFILSVGAIFVLFMVISDSSIMESFKGRSNNVGSVNGTDISYQEFSKLLDRAKENQKAQTGKDIDEDNMDQFRDQVWDAIVTQTLIKQQIDKYGITVSDQEVADIILGENPPEFLRQNFVDSTGRFNRQAYMQAIREPRNKAALIQAEDLVKQQRLQEKLQSVLFASINVSENEIKRKFVDQTINMSSDYVFVDLNNFPDNSISITNDELKKYYDDNLDKFKVVPQRRLKYVLFMNAASSADSLAIEKNLESVLETMKKDTSSFESFVKTYSANPYSKDTIGLNVLSPAAITLLENAKPNSVVGPVATQEGYVLYKYITSVAAKDPLVRASHILIQKTNDDAKDLSDAMNIYNQLQKGADFAKLAREYSKDPGSAARGGDLGYFGKGSMVKEFDDAAMSGKVGEVLKPIKTSYGYHIIKVTARSNSKFVVEKIVNPIKASPATIEKNQNDANDFAYLAQKSSFEKEAELMKYKVLETAPFNEDAVYVPGIGYNKKITEFAFANSLNTIGESYRVQNGHVVFKISDVTNAGVKKFEEVREYVKSLVLKDKKYAKAIAIAKDIKSKVGNDLSKANSVFQQAAFASTGNFTAAGSVPGIGKDWAFIDNSLKLPKGSVSEPIKGQRGVYLIKVTQRTDYDKAAYQLQRNSFRDNVLMEKKNTYFNQWLAKLKKDSKIVDNRYLFFGK